MVLRDIEEFNMPVIVISDKVRNPKIPHLAQSSICNLPTVDCRLPIAGGFFYGLRQASSQL